MPQRIAITIFFCLLSVSSLLAIPIDLTKQDFYIKHGFSSDDVRVTEFGKSWMLILKSKNGRRRIRVQDYQFENIQKRSMFSLKRNKPEEFTFSTIFSIGDKAILNDEILGLYLSHIGLNWEVYLNGKCIKKEMFLNDAGEIERYRGLRGVLINLNSKYLLEGNNLLSFRIIGDPTCPFTGFFHSKPYIIDRYDKLQNEQSEIFSLILAFLYLFIGIYHIYLFLLRRAEKYNLYYSLFSMGVFAYFIARSTYVFSIIPDSQIALRFEYIIAYSLLPVFGLFLDDIINHKISKFTKGYIFYSILIAILTVPTPIPFARDLLRIWQYSAIIPLSYYLIFVVGLSFIKNVQNLMRMFSIKQKTYVFIRSIWKALFRSVSGNLLLGVIIGICGVVFDILDSLFFSSGFVVSQYAFFIVVLGVMLVLTNRFQAMYNEIEALNKDLKSNIIDLNDANKFIRFSETRYRLLVEGTDDLIFSLNTDFNFITINSTMSKTLGLSTIDIKNKNFFDILFEKTNERSVTIHLIKDKFERLINEKKPVQFKGEFKSVFRAEPIELHCRLEYLEIEGRNEIIGKAVHAADDALIRYFKDEQQKYVIGNYLVTAEELSHRISRNLVKYIKQKESTLVRIALREILVNAIEHGNLNITFDEKSKVKSHKEYMKILAQRQKDVRYKDRNILIEYSINENKVVYKITDDGDGFNHEQYISRIEEVNDSLLSHGRGILMAKNIFDEIIYNEKGNQVTLIKHFI